MIRARKFSPFAINKCWYAHPTTQGGVGFPLCLRMGQQKSLLDVSRLCPGQPVMCSLMLGFFLVQYSDRGLIVRTLDQALPEFFTFEKT